MAPGGFIPCTHFLTRIVSCELAFGGGLFLRLSLACGTSAMAEAPGDARQSSRTTRANISMRRETRLSASSRMGRWTGIRIGLRRYHSECHVCHGPMPKARLMRRPQGFGEKTKLPGIFGSSSAADRTSPRRNKVMPALGDNKTSCAISTIFMFISCKVGRFDLSRTAAKA